MSFFATVKNSIEVIRKNEKKRKKENEKIINANPYIHLIDPYLNYLTDITKVCVDYLPIDYCDICADFFPRRVGCLTHKIGWRISYKSYGSFSINNVNNSKSMATVKFHCEEDIMFLDYINHRMPMMWEINSDSFIVRIKNKNIKNGLVNGFIDVTNFGDYNFCLYEPDDADDVWYGVKIE